MSNVLEVSTFKLGPPVTLVVGFKTLDSTFHPANPMDIILVRMHRLTIERRNTRSDTRATIVPFLLARVSKSSFGVAARFGGWIVEFYSVGEVNKTRPSLSSFQVAGAGVVA